MEDPIPCYQCLVLAMCKSKVSTYKPMHSTRFVQASMLGIRLNCNLFYHYIKPTRGDVGLSKHRRRLAVHFLTGIDIGEDEDLYGLSYNIEEVYAICGQEELIYKGENNETKNRIWKDDGRRKT